MKVIVFRLSLFCVSIIFMSMILTCGGDAKVNLKSAVGIWLFDEGTGDQAKDSSGNGNHGNLVKSPKWVNGKFGMALQFDGKSNYVVSSKNVGISGNAERTIVFWFKPTSSEGRQSIVVWGAAETLKMNFVEYNGYQGGPNNIYVGGYDCDAYTEETLPLNQWHHVAAVRSKKISETKIYYNGVSQEIKLFNNGGEELDTVDSPVSIGYDLVLNRQPFEGAIDEVAIFNVVLAENDVKDIMTKGFKNVLSVSSAGKLATVWGTIKIQ
jgi:hypothetical protein